jgi:hypothetical protein
VKQYASDVTVRFDDEAVAELFDELVDRGLRPHRFGRIWIHTHPGDSPLPSPTDEETFARCFSRCDWAVMFIVSQTEQAYARLSFPPAPAGAFFFRRPFTGATGPMPWRPARASMLASGSGSANTRPTSIRCQICRHCRSMPRTPVRGGGTENRGAPNWTEQYTSPKRADYPMTCPSDRTRDRDIRQRDIVPPERLAQCQAVVIGVGAIGRQAALQSAAAGIPLLVLYDHHTVAVDNLATQGYRPDQLGLNKADTLPWTVSASILPGTQSPAGERFRRSAANQITVG